MDLDKLKLLILDLISPVREVPTDALTSLSEAELSEFLVIARQHRLEPMLFWRLAHEKRDCQQPEALRGRLANQFKQAALRALTVQRELLLVHRILQAAGIPHVALKGAFLAFHAYPNPALRPLRDVDILVPQKAVLEAYQALIDGGLQRIKAYAGDPEATLVIGHHLPPLLSPSANVHVELHARLFHQDKSRNSREDLSEDQAFWARVRSISVASNEVPFESSTDLLLHMIVHAVYDHQFTNGPLLLSDLAYLLTSQPIDWPLFWRLAHDRGQVRGCLLAFGLLERYWGKLPVTFPENLVRADMVMPIDDAALMMLRDFDARTDVTLGNEVAAQASLLRKLKLLLSKAFPPKVQIAAQYPVSQHSLRVYFWYPVKWWSLLAFRLPRYLRSLTHDRVQGEVQGVREIERWLAAESV
ncbi:nucleotidyltransferase family protein [Azonexus caeni]|jgi:hypothetical protein|uniref:nucleotidyltransferase domain-containing protein n=1 Tax=Azonexus caeni TaxID=266126 RepID=UPI003A8A9891